MQMVSLLEAAN